MFDIQTKEILTLTEMLVRFVQMYVSAETKHVLALPSNRRTEQQIAKVCHRFITVWQGLSLLEGVRFILPHKYVPSGIKQPSVSSGLNIK
jgi:hypothetical protein